MSLAIRTISIHPGAHEPVKRGIFLRLLAGLLIFAAIAKAYEAWGDPSLPATTWLQIGLELTLAGWLVSGLWRRWAGRVVLVVFALFAGVSLNKVLQGAAHCGCFGPVRVSPSYSFLLDVTIVALLVLRGWGGRLSPGRSRARIIGSACIWVAGLLALGVGRHHSAAVAQARASDNLDARQWLGKPLPILNSIDVAPRLAGGSWIVTFYRVGCPACQEVIDQMIKHAVVGNVPHALIQVPPIQDLTGLPRLPRDWIVGQLDPARTWLIQTPLTVQIRQGNVIGILTEGEAGMAPSAGFRIDAPPDAIAARVSPTRWLAEVGSVTPGKQLRIIFKLTSPTGGDLLIRGVNASCGCTSMPRPPSLIRGMGETETEVMFRVAKGAGRFESDILLTTNAPQLPPLTLGIRGQIP